MPGGKAGTYGAKHPARGLKGLAQTAVKVQKRKQKKAAMKKKYSKGMGY